jgi:transcriptional regulator GlxA family with amidase domain
MPPHRYLLELRIKHAKELLATTGLNLQEIAAYCGFADIHHFSKAFKKAIGLPPGEFRIQSADG